MCGYAGVAPSVYFCRARGYARRITTRRCVRFDRRQYYVRGIRGWREKIRPIRTTTVRIVKLIKSRTSCRRKNATMSLYTRTMLTRVLRSYIYKIKLRLRAANACRERLADNGDPFEGVLRDNRPTQCFIIFLETRKIQLRNFGNCH